MTFNNFPLVILLSMLVGMVWGPSIYDMGIGR